MNDHTVDQPHERGDTVTTWRPVRALRGTREELIAREQSEVLLGWLRDSGAEPRHRGSEVRTA